MTPSEVNKRAELGEKQSSRRSAGPLTPPPSQPAEQVVLLLLPLKAFVKRTWALGCSLVRRVLAQQAKGLGFDAEHFINQAWWCMSAIPALRLWRQEDQKFQATWSIWYSISYIYNHLCIVCIREIDWKGRLCFLSWNLTVWDLPQSPHSSCAYSSISRSRLALWHSLCSIKSKRLNQFSAVEMESVEKKFLVQAKRYRTNGKMSILK